MRPINLIPQEERRSRSTVTRSGPLAYLIVGALAVLLVGVVMLVLTSNQISDRESEVTTLSAEMAAATARAEELTPYVNFAEVTEQRTQTVAELADSRFDWARVIQQLSLILPSDVYLNTLNGSAGGGSGAGGEAAAGITGPSLSMQGCASSQDGVAAFVAALKVIDGVTRVGLNSSTATGDGTEAVTGASACSVGNKTQFDIVVAFDAAPPSPDSSTAISEAESTEGEAAEGEESTESTEGESSESTEGEAPATPEGEAPPAETGGTSEAAGAQAAAPGTAGVTG